MTERHVCSLALSRRLAALANHPDGGGHILYSSDGTPEARIAWARRILEDK